VTTELRLLTDQAKCPFSARSIEDSVAAVKNHLDGAVAHLRWQVHHQVWQSMGLETWAAFKAAQYGPGRILLVDRIERTILVPEMWCSGLTKAEIAEALGAGLATVHRDLEVFRLENPGLAAEVEATPHRKSGQPRTHARRRRVPVELPQDAEEDPNDLHALLIGDSRILG
jgi:hypothetical protein